MIGEWLDGNSDLGFTIIEIIFEFAICRAIGSLFSYIGGFFDE
jgi:hypothetical protein